MLEAKPRIIACAGSPTGAAKSDVEKPRFGLTITKKIGNAVERNRIRRRMKEAIRRQQDEFAEPHTDYVLIARRPALDCEFAQLVKDLQDALQRVRSPAKRPAKMTAQSGRAPKQP